MADRCPPRVRIARALWPASVTGWKGSSRDVAHRELARVLGVAVGGILPRAANSFPDRGTRVSRRPEWKCRSQGRLAGVEGPSLAKGPIWPAWRRDRPSNSGRSATRVKTTNGLRGTEKHGYRRSVAPGGRVFQDLGQEFAAPGQKNGGLVRIWRANSSTRLVNSRSKSPRFGTGRLFFVPRLPSLDSFHANFSPPRGRSPAGGDQAPYHGHGGRVFRRRTVPVCEIDDQIRSLFAQEGFLKGRLQVCAAST